MPQVDSLIGLLDSRSFMTIWYWLTLIGMWSATGRSVLGVPSEVLARARAARAKGDIDGPAVIALLDWLSLVLPRWQLGPREGVVFLGVTSFLMSSMTVLGFVFWLELAQALVLLLFPFWLLFWMRTRLARRLMPVIEGAQDDRLSLAEAGAECARKMAWHRTLVTMLSIAAVAVTVLWGTLWAIMHPNGL
ncbi:hypothetical protein [Paracoccus rhizosphaerae]|uniref:Uncharacterized protein n=1 Tax=Paracoccus rhizosphaerae TaxID=1133347 RepID=A0ABV6CEH2_9RHOB|nr:hypothetical protein [Paracoccus rhizosphaerae]